MISKFDVRARRWRGASYLRALRSTFDITDDVGLKNAHWGIIIMCVTEPLFIETRLKLFISLKMWRVPSSTILNIWASLPNLRRNTLVFCYCYWVIINKITLTAISIRLKCSKRYWRYSFLSFEIYFMLGCWHAKECLGLGALIMVDSLY